MRTRSTNLADQIERLKEENEKLRKKLFEQRRMTREALDFVKELRRKRDKT